MGAIQSIVAAAARIISGKGGKIQTGSGNGATTLAWDHYETVPEVGAYADYISNAMSGAFLFAGKRTADGTIDRAPDDSRAAQLVSSIAGGPDGQSIVLGSFGTQISVAGDCWVIIIPGEPKRGLAGESDGGDLADDRWVILSTEEVQAQRGKIKAMIDGEEIEIPEWDPDSDQDPEIPVFFRVWRPSPRRQMQATSPVIRAAVVLEELRILNAAVAAIARSRITGRGLLLVPAGARFPTQPGQDGAEDSLLETFIEVASTAMREPESAAATVPIVLEIPGDLIGGVKWIEFSSDFDSLAIQLRDEAVRRFASGSDVPAEVLLGLGDTNHWGAWALTAEALRLGVEPKLALFCQAVTTAWLQPLLEDEGDPEADQWIVWYDTSGLRSSSNKGANALEAYREGIISGQAARRELGFTEDDAPTAPRPTPATTGGNDLPVNDTQTTPALEASAASRDMILDSFTAQTSAAVAAAVDGLVWSALAVAGRKLMLTPAVPRSARGTARELVASATVHTVHTVPDDASVARWKLLDGAWARVPEVAQRYGIDPLTLTKALHEYVSALLTTGSVHEFDNVPRLLAQMRVDGIPLERSRIA